MIKQKSSINKKIERQILIQMIVNSDYLKQILPIYQQSSLSASYSTIIAGWCSDYFDRYEVAPGKDIESIYQRHYNNGLDDSKAEIIQKFLSSLSDEYENEEIQNTSYLIDQAEKYFREQSLLKMKDDLSAAILNSDLEAAEAIVGGYNRVLRVESRGADLITDKAIIARAFNPESDERMYTMPGDLGKLIGNFKRGSLVAVLAEQKRGKTWWLQELGLRGLFTGYSWLHVSFENTIEQMTIRLHQRLSGKLSPDEEAQTIKIPVIDCLHNQNNKCQKRKRTSTFGILDSNGRKPEFDSVDDYEICGVCRGTNDFKAASWFIEKYKEPQTMEKAIKKGQRLKTSKLRGAKYRFEIFRPDTTSISDLRTMLYNLEHYDGFIPDIITTDYADKMLASKTGFKEQRQVLNKIWEEHKGLALERHCLVFTASQSNTVRAGKDIGKGDWANDISKLNEVDKAIAVNQTDEELLMGYTRVSKIAERHERYNALLRVMVTQSLDIGNPCLDSAWMRR